MIWLLSGKKQLPQLLQVLILLPLKKFRALKFSNKVAPEENKKIAKPDKERDSIAEIIMSLIAKGNITKSRNVKEDSRRSPIKEDLNMEAGSTFDEVKSIISKSASLSSHVHLNKSSNEEKILENLDNAMNKSSNEEIILENLDNAMNKSSNEEIILEDLDNAMNSHNSHQEKTESDMLELYLKFLSLNEISKVLFDESDDPTEEMKEFAYMLNAAVGFILFAVNILFGLYTALALAGMTNKEDEN